MKFESTTAGTVTGVRFYKQTWMNGYTHVGYLWSATGSLLASATFTGESSYGWEQVNFASPVAISTNTVYIASFSTGGGYFGITTGFFNSAGVTNGPLQALSNSTPGGDGVYQSGAAAFPSVNGSGMNFWVDVAFAPRATASASSTVAPKPVSTATQTQVLARKAGGGNVASAYVITPAATPATTTGGHVTRGLVQQDAAVTSGWRSYRRAAAQEPTTTSAHPTGAAFAARGYRRASGTRA